MESVLLGAVGTVAGLVNAFPEETLRLWKLATEGRYAEALDLYRWFTPVLHLDCHPKLVQYIKLAQAMCGYGTEDCRAPRLPLVGAERPRGMALIPRAIDTRPALAASARGAGRREQSTRPLPLRGGRAAAHRHGGLRRHFTTKPGTRQKGEGE